VPRKAKTSPATEPVPLGDDPRWLPLISAHEQLTKRVGNPALAAADLRRELTNRRLRSKWKRIVDGVCELTPEGYWDDHAVSFEVGHYGLHGLHIVPLRPPGLSEGVLPLRSVTDRAFFVWGPDFNAPDPDATAQTPAKGAAGNRPRAWTDPKEFKKLVSFYRGRIGLDKNRKEADATAKAKFGPIPRVVRDDARRKSDFSAFNRKGGRPKKS
jgi:hypothetical protein